ncbi:hypothetical protein [Lysobacter sp. A03]|uniref:hypothetical protein n=1 Tax=Lysobacter sp. A03 TaxID=1199154 RepID=UPI0005B745CA|nr:hypothetical protein [Lysobacter sp. A03]KIQ97898.1 hypothetical protein TI01_0525 [Lysobacter sp. A03]
MSRSGSVAAMALLLMLSACASAPPAPTPVAVAFDPAAMMATIDQAGVADSRELVVRPLTDGHMEGLKEQLGDLRAPDHLAATAQQLDRALESHPDDAELLQSRAENAILQRDLATAERMARRAAAAGAQAGPHCRRHWETVVQVLHAGAADGDAIAAAQASRDACTVAAPPRY